MYYACVDYYIFLADQHYCNEYTYKCSVVCKLWQYKNLSLDITQVILMCDMSVIIRGEMTVLIIL